VRTHTLQAGETLRSVAQRYGVTGQALLAANPQLDLRSGLYAGISINIPVPTIAPVPARRIGPRSFDVPESAYAPSSGVPAAPGALQPPTSTGVRLSHAPPRTFFSVPNTQALPP
jgi:LysM repeat protein